MNDMTSTPLMPPPGSMLEVSLLIAAIVLFLYPLVVYPALIVTLAWIFPRPVVRSRPDPLPTVTIIVPAFDEETVISEKIENSMAIDYPADRLEMIVASDGSGDRTAEIVRSFPDNRVRLLDFKERRGKLAVLNEVVPLASGEIVVFSDASAMLAPDALKKLVANFSDPSVGCVSGRYAICHEMTPILDGRSAGEQGYFAFEVFQRIRESRFFSTLGAHGAFYGIRRKLYPTIPSDVVNDDFVIPMKILEGGYRTVYEEKAIVFERHRSTVSGEFKRRVRISHGNFQQIVMLPALLGFQNPRVSFVFWSHKVLRNFQPLFLGMILFLPLMIGGALFQLFFLLQVAFYVLGGVALFFRLTTKLLALPLYFALGNVAILAGFLRFLKARTGPVLQWEKG
ncbi:MAG: glycosyltransferase family 2 protein [Leptospirales bacterium]